jgi:hypothetical protein
VSDGVDGRSPLVGVQFVEDLGVAEDHLQGVRDLVDQSGDKLSTHRRGPRRYLGLTCHPLPPPYAR